jgi:MerR family transcriptional regulator, copper efflux regulator
MSEQSKLISIKQAAQLLGVTALTLRNWDANGKLKALRHPMNNYRVYKREDIEKLIEQISNNTIAAPTRRKSSRKLEIKHLEE